MLNVNTLWPTKCHLFLNIYAYDYFQLSASKYLYNPTIFVIIFNQFSIITAGCWRTARMERSTLTVWTPWGGAPSSWPSTTRTSRWWSSSSSTRSAYVNHKYQLSTSVLRTRNYLSSVQFFLILTPALYIYCHFKMYYNSNNIRNMSQRWQKWVFIHPGRLQSEFSTDDIY